MRFYLGTHEVSWLGRTELPLFIARPRLQRQRRWPRALGPWALDSGGFTELGKHGGWSVTAARYADEVRRYRDEIGQMEWASPQDWMCEPEKLAQTGLSITEHQVRTVDNLIELRALAPDLTFIPVLQGWTLPDYLRCVELYEQAGVPLADEPRVGVGSVCRRQATGQVLHILTALRELGLNLHGYGMKTGGLQRCTDLLTSADSLAWSYRARRARQDRGGAPSPPPCTHQSCANCLPFALTWRRAMLTTLPDTARTGTHPLFDLHELYP